MTITSPSPKSFFGVKILRLIMPQPRSHLYLGEGVEEVKNAEIGAIWLKMISTIRTGKAIAQSGPLCGQSQLRINYTKGTRLESSVILEKEWCVHKYSTCVYAQRNSLASWHIHHCGISSNLTLMQFWCLIPNQKSKIDTIYFTKFIILKKKNFIKGRCLPNWLFFTGRSMLDILKKSVPTVFCTQNQNQWH